MATVENFKVKVTTEGVDGLDKLGRSADFARDKIGGLTTAILGVSFGAFIGSLLNAADRVADLSDATGISVVNIKAFEDAMASSGGKAKNAEKAILAFTGAIESANDGSLKSRDAFAKVGVSLTDLKNLSEQDLLQKTVEGLSKMEKGSERTAAQAILLGKSFRGINVDKFIEDFESGKITAEAAAESIEKMAAANDKLEKAFRTLQEEATKALTPILDLLEKHELSGTAAKVAIYGLATAMGLAFGASMLSSIKTINSALGITAALSNLVGKGPLGIIAKLAASGALAAGTAIEIEKLVTANDKLTASEENYRGKGFKDPRINKGTGGTGNAGRTQELDARQKAELESAKRTAQNLADAELQVNLINADKIERIQLEMRSNIAKGVAEIRSKSDLSESTKAKEILSLVNKETKKSYADIAEYRLELEKQILEYTMQGNQQLLQTQAEEFAALTALQTNSKQQIDSSLKSMREQNIELQNRFDIQQAINGLGNIEQKRISDIADAVRNYNAELKKIQSDTNLNDSEFASRIEELNALLEQRVEILNRTAQAETDRQNSFGAGVKDQIKQYKESITAFKIGGQMVDSVYGNMMSALERFVKQGKFSFKEFAQSVILDLVMIEARANATRLFTSLFSFGGSSVPGRALGGPVLPNQPYIVGEKGPEVFLPNAAGNIIPNNKLGSSGSFGGGASVTYNINAVDAPSFRQMIAKDPSFLYAVTEQGRKSIPSTRR